MDKDFEFARYNDSTVYQMLRRGCSLESIIGQLSTEKELLIDQIGRLESIAPRKLIKADGTVMMSNIPPELIPEYRTIRCS